MDLVILGSGSTVPHRGRKSSGYWVETGDAKLLLDCSASVPSQIAAEGLDLPKLDSIWISHFHMDHCGGLAPLLVGTKHVPEMTHRTKPLRIYGPAGLRDLIDRFDAGRYRLLDQPFPIEIIDVNELERFEIASGIQAIAMSTLHTPESHAIHLTEEEIGRTLVFSSDTALDERLATLANGVDLFILECCFVRNRPDVKHLELSEAMFLIRKEKPKRALLTHFYPEWDLVDLEAELHSFAAPCEVIGARDGLRLTI